MISAITVRRACLAGLLLLGVLSGLGAQETVPPSPAAEENRRDALQAYRNRQYQLAIDITLAEIKAQPDNMDSYAVLCWSMNALKRHADTIRFANEARRHNSSDHRIVGALAEAHFASGNNAQAIAFFQLYVSMTSRIPGYETRYIRDAYRDLAEAFRKVGELHHADVALSAAIQYDKGPAALEPARQAELWLRLGNIRVELKDLAGARLALNEALAKNPGLQAARTALDALPLQ